jgi:hypothetical protein
LSLEKRVIPTKKSLSLRLKNFVIPSAAGANATATEEPAFLQLPPRTTTADPTVEERRFSAAFSPDQ